jgi:hypothetical protein
MTQNVIYLEDYRAAHTCHATGVEFPQLYRNIGHIWELDGEERPVPSSELAPPAYTLGKPHDCGLAKVESEIITHLDQKIDSGPIVIRHFRSTERADGYLDALMDLQFTQSQPQVIFRTKTGIFAVSKGETRPSQEQHVLIYIAQVHTKTGVMDVHTIIGPDGKYIDPEEYFG